MTLNFNLGKICSFHRNLPSTSTQLVTIQNTLRFYSRISYNNNYSIQKVALLTINIFIVCGCYEWLVKLTPTFMNARNVCCRQTVKSRNIQNS